MKSVNFFCRWNIVLFVFMALGISACGGSGDGSSGGNTPATDTYSISGTLTGLNGTGLEVRINGTETLLISTDGNFEFPTELVDGSSYTVDVSIQPLNVSQTCTVTNGSGTVSGANVNNINIQCVTNNFTIGGNVSGLLGSGLELQNNAGDDLSISSDGNFNFTAAVASGDNYNVTVLAQPSAPQQNCIVNNATGLVANSDVTNVEIICSDAIYSIGGTVSGLTGNGLVLQNNGGDNLSVNPGETSFTFASLLADGDSYNVTVLSQPSGQSCIFEDGESGTVPANNVTNVIVSCENSSSAVGRFISSGPVAGLRYSTDTLSGETNANGEFNYQTGETIRFFIGDIPIGQAVGATSFSIVHPFRLTALGGLLTGSGEIVSAVNLAKSFPQPTDLDVVSNIAVLLETIDEDGDASNGITIPTELHNIATGSSLSLQQKRLQFANDFALRKLLADGRTAGLWGGSRAIRNRAYAMDALYAGIGTGTAAPIYVRESLSIDNGTPPSPPDGTADRITTYSFDSAGNRTVIANDFDADGVADDIETRTFDANGNELTFEDDNDGDGSPDQRKTSTYDANGNLTRIEVEYFDGSGDTYVETFEYNPFDQLTRHEYDYRPADGTPDERDEYLYDPVDGYLLQHDIDIGLDGVDSRKVYTYDGTGNRTAVNVVDVNNSSIILSSTTYTYTTEGYVATETYDSNGDGSFPLSITSYDYDANGGLIQLSYDHLSIDSLDDVYTYQNDSRGNRIRQTRDRRNDGTIDAIDVRVYDSNGNLTADGRDDDDNGVADGGVTIAYDREGYASSLDNDSDYDGVSNSTETYTVIQIDRWSALGW